MSTEDLTHLILREIRDDGRHLRQVVENLRTEVNARIDATNDRIDAANENLNARIDATNDRIEAVNENLNARTDALVAEMRAGFAAVLQVLGAQYTGLDGRVTRLEDHTGIAR